MKENTKDKMMIEINQNNIFYKIKLFFRKLFNKTSRNINELNNVTEKINISKIEINKNLFMEDIKKVENEETKLLKLQQKYRRGEIRGEDLTLEQIKALCVLYDKQIETLKKSNEIKKQKLLEYRKKLHTEN